MQFTSPSRRALGVLAVSTMGLTTAVLGVTGVAQAAPLTWTASGSGVQEPIPAGICSVEWVLYGGGAGFDSAGMVSESGAGVLYASYPAAEGDVFTLDPGGRGTDADANTLAPGTGGTRVDGDVGLEGGDGTADAEVAGGGGGAASTVALGGDVVLQAYGADGYGELGGLGGGEDSFDVGANWSEGDFDTSGEPGMISGEGIPCTPAAPYLNYAEELDQALRLDFVPGEDGELDTTHFEYTKDGGTTWTALTGITTSEGRSSATVGGLTNGTEYTVKVRSVAANGATTESGEVTGTPHKAATAPSNVKVTTGAGEMTVTWGASTAGTYAITGYHVGLVWSTGQSGGQVDFCETGPAVFTCTAPAQPGVKHDVVVYAVHGTNPRMGEWGRVMSGVVPASTVVPESDGAMELPAGTSSSVPAGKTITVSGEGYAPFSTVTVLIYSEPQILTTVVTDMNGAFTVSVTVPAGLAPGSHTLVASGVDGTGQLRFVTLPVTVVAGLAYTGADIAVPAIGGLAALTVGGALLVVARRRRAG